MKCRQVVKTEDMKYPRQNTEALKESFLSSLLTAEVSWPSRNHKTEKQKSYNKKRFDPFLKNTYNLHCTGESKSPGVAGKHAV